MQWMIDWVSVRQEHQHHEIVGKNVCLWLDSESGAVLSEGVGYLSHEGSFSTSVSIRAHGGVVEWSGNPSRWGRADNVWGYTSLRHCIEKVINPHLESYGLPPFTLSPGWESNSFQSRRRQKEGKDTATVTTGAVLTRVDLCRNLSTGSPAAKDAYLRAASAAVYRGKAPSTFPGSVAWGHARNSRLKIYDKGQELVDHTNRRSPNPNNVDLVEYQRRFAEWSSYAQYRERLANWCLEIGMIRQEVTLGRQALRSLGLRSYDEWSDDRASTVALERFDAMKIGCTVGLGDAFTTFLDAGMTKRQASVLSGVVSNWYQGVPVRDTVSRATWYRYRSTVRDLLGLDLDSTPDVSVLNTRVRTVELSAVEPPHWYRHAA